MAKPANKSMQPGNTVQIDSHAAATLRYIRASMEAAASLNVPGSAAIAVGVVGVLAAACSSIPVLQQLWLVIWLVAAVVAGGVGSVLMVQQSSLRELTFSGAPVRKFALCLLPSLFAGAVVTAVHWLYGNLHAIPGTWLLLYGCGLIAASAVSGRTICAMGAAFLSFGLLALLLPDSVQILMLGAGFGGLHLLFGFFMRRARHGREI